MERFLYEVRPMRPIIIPGKQGVKKPFTALLTIDEVRDYMKYGPVFRKYAEYGKEMVRVTGENINLLHRAPESNTPAKKISVADVLPAETKVNVEQAEPKKFNVEESTAPVVEDSSIEEINSNAVEEPVADDSPVDTNDGKEIIDSKEEVEAVEEPTETTDVDQESDTLSESPLEEVEGTDEEVVESTESEEQVEDSTDEASEEVRDANDNKQHNNYNGKKKHKNNYYNNNVNVQISKQQ